MATDQDMALIRQAWSGAGAALRFPAEEGDAALAPVLAMYQSATRHYHNLAHIANCLRELASLRRACENADVVAVALVFHDCIYDATRKDNEERSADVAAATLSPLGAAPAIIEAVRALILWTTHQKVPSGGDAAVMVDIDLAGLGKSPEAFDRDTDAIRREFPHVDDAAFTAGRVRFIQGLLARPHLYQTSLCRARYEVAARENLQRAIRRLEGSLL